MRIVAIRRTNTEHRIRREAAPGRVPPVSTVKRPSKDAENSKPTTALVATESDATQERRSFVRYRPNAAFLAHLIATRENVPQLRARRRTEPETAIASYNRTEASARNPQPGRIIAVAY